MNGVPPEQRRHHEQVDPHQRARWLSDVVLGGQDGLVNVLGVVLGVAAASAETRLVLAAGLAAAVAESVSMAAVAFTSTRASGEVFRAERAREYRHVEAAPELEKAEVRELYARKGFEGELLDRIVDTITRDKDVWVAVMMAEEHALAPVDTKSSLRSAAIVGVSSFIGSLLPLVPYVWLDLRVAAILSVAMAAVTLFAFGAFKGAVTVGRPLRSGLELAAIGTLSALVGYAVGLLFRVGPDY